MTTNDVRPARDIGNTIADAEHVNGVFEEQLDDFTARTDSKPGKKAVVTPARLEAHRLRYEALRRAEAGQEIEKGVLTGTTFREIVAREDAYDQVIEIRDDIADVFPNDLELRRQWGYGTKIDRSDTGGLLTVSQRFCNLGTRADDMQRIEGSGVTQKRLDTLGTAHDALAAANKAQDLQRGTRKATTAEKNALLKEVRDETKALRQIAFRAYRKEPAIRKLFESTVPQHAVSHRGSSGNGASASNGSADPPKGGASTAAAAKPKKPRRKAGGGAYAKKVGQAQRYVKAQAAKSKPSRAKKSGAKKAARKATKPTAKRKGSRKKK